MFVHDLSNINGAFDLSEDVTEGVGHREQVNLVDDRTEEIVELSFGVVCEGFLKVIQDGWIAHKLERMGAIGRIGIKPQKGYKRGVRAL